VLTGRIHGRRRLVYRPQTAGPRSSINEAFSFQIATEISKRPTANGTPLSAMEARRVRAAGARTDGHLLASHAARATEAMAAGGDESQKRAFDAMMDMKKIDVAAIKAARRG